MSPKSNTERDSESEYDADENHVCTIDDILLAIRPSVRATSQATRRSSHSLPYACRVTRWLLVAHLKHSNFVVWTLVKVSVIRKFGS